MISLRLTVIPYNCGVVAMSSSDEEKGPPSAVASVDSGAGHDDSDGTITDPTISREESIPTSPPPKAP